MQQHVKEFLETLNSGHNMDFIKNEGYRFSKQELVSICAELFYTAYQEATDGGCKREEDAKEDYAGFIRAFISNMNEYEDGYFKDEDEYFKDEDEYFKDEDEYFKDEDGYFKDEDGYFKDED